MEEINKPTDLAVRYSLKAGLEFTAFPNFSSVPRVQDVLIGFNGIHVDGEPPMTDRITVSNLDRDHVLATPCIGSASVSL